MARFTLRQLEYVRAIARDGGIAQAARSLSISQPSVAQGLEKLEAMTGLVLFDRHHARGVTLTAQGRQFLGHAADLLDHAEQVDRDATALAAHKAGEIRLGCFATIAAFYLPETIRSFKDAYPDVRVSAEEANLDGLANRVRSGDLDACLTYEIGDSLDGLNVRPLAVIAPTVMVSPRHPCAGKSSITLRELAGEPYVMYDAPGSREYFDALLHAAGLAPRIAYASQTLEGVRSAVGAGFGFSIAGLLPDHETTYEGTRVIAIPILDEIAPLKIVAASRASGETNRMVMQFVEHAVEAFETAG